MQNISKALVVAVQYIGEDRNDADYTEDDDIKLVEELMTIMEDASAEEKAALIEAAKALGLPDWAYHFGLEERAEEEDEDEDEDEAEDD